MASDDSESPNAATVLQNLLKWASAHSEFGQLLSTGIPPAQALAKWGGQLFRENLIAEAIEAFRAASALAPDDPLVWTNLGLAYDKQNSPVQSAKCLERSLKIFPEQPETWLLWGVAQQKCGDLAGAEAACRTALEKGVASALAWQCIGLIKQAQRQYSAAIECLLQCSEGGLREAATQAILGRLYYQTGQFPEALTAYAEAAELEPANAHYQQMLRRVRFICDVMAEVPVDVAMETFRRSAVEKGEVSSPELRELFQTAFGQLSGFGQDDAAARVGQRLHQLWPSVTTEYLLKAMSGDNDLTRTPPLVVAEHFDAFAPEFDAQLVERLEYDVPGKICHAVRSAINPDMKYDVLDAGCGTGLCAPHLRPFARELIGVDLSPKMLEQAERRRAYDTLICEDLATFLARSVDRFDILVAADVLIYFGDLRPVFAEAAAALRPGGLLAMSTEFREPSGEGYHLEKSGRFAHSPDYVRGCAAGMFAEALYLDTTVRLEANQPVRGNIFLFRRIEC